MNSVRFDCERSIPRAPAWLSWRPVRPGWQVVRALGIALVGVGMVVYPTFTAQFLAVCAGLTVFFWGVAELDRVAEMRLAADREAVLLRAATSTDAATPARRRFSPAWLIPIGAAGLAVLIAVSLLVPQALPQSPTQPVAATNDPQACNAHG